MLKILFLNGIIVVFLIFAISPVFAETSMQSGQCVVGEPCSFTITLGKDQKVTLTAAQMSPISFVEVLVSDLNGNIIIETTLQKYKYFDIPKQVPGEYTIEFVEFQEGFTFSIDLTFTDLYPEVDSTDDIPPIILQPNDIEINAQTENEVIEVNFEVLATDDTDNTIQPICKPLSGYLFGIGETRVTCTARDSAGNFATPVSFTVKINPPQTQIDPPSLDLDAGPADTSAQKIPDWVRNIFLWYGQDQISEDEIISAIQYLINEGIIKLD